jgi:hypothetical protein
VLAAGVPERLAEEVDAAALPGAAEHLPDRLLQPCVRVGDDELDAREAGSTSERRKLRQNASLSLADVEADHLPIAGLVHPVGEHKRLADDAAAVSDLLDVGVEIRSPSDSTTWSTFRVETPATWPPARPRPAPAPSDAVARGSSGSNSRGRASGSRIS